MRNLKPLLMLSIAAVFGFAACGGDDITCGEGTTKVGDSCVADSTGDVTCGTGTTETDGVCEADGDGGTTCGTGTTLANGECVSDTEEITCADGTVKAAAECVVDASACGMGTTLDVATNTCLGGPSISCGAGTVADAAGATCVVDPSACAAGTTFDMATGTCAPDVVCGAGTIANNGECLLPGDVTASMADVTETENNDPNRGGTAETLPFPTMADSTIFVGVINPADADGDGTVDEDSDAWTFTGTAGTHINIGVTQNGDTPVGFFLEGPNGLVLGTNVTTGSSARDFALPYDGDYTVTVVSLVNLFAASLSGGSEAQYVGVFELLPAIAPVATVPGGGAITGNAQDLSDQMFQITANTGAAISVDIQYGNDVQGTAWIINDGNVVEATSGVFTVAADNALNVLVDHSFVQGADDSFSLTIDEIPTTILGDLNAAPITSGAIDLATYDGLANVQFTVSAPVVAQVLATVASTNDTTWTFTSPSGETTTETNDSDFRWFFSEVGTYSVVINDQDNATIDFTMTPFTTTEVALDAAAPVTVNAGPLADNEFEFYYATTASPVIVDAAATPDGAGQIDFRYFTRENIESFNNSGSDTFNTAGTAATIDTRTIEPGDIAVYMIEGGTAGLTTLSTVFTSTAIVCGDGLIQGSEVCDDGNAVDNDGCDATCSNFEDGYDCDNAEPTVCAPVICGDGIINGAEVCDDGNTADMDGCNATCDAFEAGYECDNAEPTVCIAVVCGDGIVGGSEVCDDGNLVDGDGCDATCASIDAGYECAPGNCALIGCGNGILSPGEVCDDGNAVDGDGCSAACDAVEPTYLCNTIAQPSTCSLFTESTSAPASAIPDATPAGIDDTTTMAAANGCLIDQLQLELDITHTWQRDMIVSLTSPDGTLVVAIDREGDSTDNWIGIVGIDTPLSNPLDYSGENANGDWTLNVSDNAGGDFGTINSWTVRVTCQ